MSGYRLAPLPDGTAARVLAAGERRRSGCGTSTLARSGERIPCGGTSVLWVRLGNGDGLPVCAVCAGHWWRAYELQAARHGHADWSHLVAFGPCTRAD